MKIMITKNCLVCGKEFKVWPYQIKKGDGKFCSMECVGQAIREGKINHKYWLGKHRDDKTKNKISEELKGKIPWNEGLNGAQVAWNKGLNGYLEGERHYNWAGDDVGYMGIHHWVRKMLGRPTKCEYCGTDGLTGHQIHWANKDHLYRRDLKDWMRLCCSCHKFYDLAHNLNHKKDYAFSN